MKRIIEFIAGNPWSFLLAALPVILAAQTFALVAGRDLYLRRVGNHSIGGLHRRSDGRPGFLYQSAPRRVVECNLWQRGRIDHHHRGGQSGIDRIGQSLDHRFDHRQPFIGFRIFHVNGWTSSWHADIRQTQRQPQCDSACAGGRCVGHSVGVESSHWSGKQSQSRSVERGRGDHHDGVIRLSACSKYRMLKKVRCHNNYQKAICPAGP